MANKIINFGSSSENFIDSSLSASTNDVSKEVFVDVSMQSDRYSDTKNIRKWKIQKNVNVKAIFNSLRNIFSWMPGERILLPEFGSRLRSLLYEGITQQTEERIVAEIRGCVSEWEPRVSIVDVRDISTIDETEDNTIHLEVIFTIPALSDEQYSYSFTYNRSE